jgi:hypothetical protein
VWIGHRRRAVAAALLCVLIGWSVAIGALWLKRHAAKAHGAEWVAERQELRDALAGAGFRY